MKQYFYAGTYTEPVLFGTGELVQGYGAGVSICTFEDGEIKVLKSHMLVNPSYVCVDEAKRKFYAVNETKEWHGQPGGGVTQLSYDAEGNMTQEGTWGTGASDPCHLSIDPTGQLLAVANFASDNSGGALTVYNLDEAGNVQPDRKVFWHEGSGAHPIRQTCPHAHAALFLKDAPYLLVPELGMDEVVYYYYSGKEVAPAYEHSMKVPAGEGPRSGEFSRDGKHFYLINELGSKLMHCKVEDGKLIPGPSVHTLPDDFHGENICADLHLTPNGKYLYASNRGHDTIAAFKVEDNGDLTFIQRIDCGGQTPRNFSVDLEGKYLLVGNRTSSNIAVFTIGEDGLLTHFKTFPFGTPSCIRFFTQTSFPG